MRTAQRHKKKPEQACRAKLSLLRVDTTTILFPWAKVGKRSDTTKQLKGNITAK